MNAAYASEREGAPPVSVNRVTRFRRKGEELYFQAKNLTQEQNCLRNLAAVQESVKAFQSAIECFSQALDLAPADHRLLLNRALCYAAVEDLPRSRDDAARCVELDPTCAKGWLLLAKVLCRHTSIASARAELERGLLELPRSRELLEMHRVLIEGEQGGETRCSITYSISPARGSPASSPTPPPLPPLPATPAGTAPVLPAAQAMAAAYAASRPRSPILAAAASSALSGATGSGGSSGPGTAATATGTGTGGRSNTRHGSRSPGPSLGSLAASTARTLSPAGSQVLARAAAAVAAATGNARQSSRSPGPDMRLPGHAPPSEPNSVHKSGPPLLQQPLMPPTAPTIDLEMSGSFVTGNFGTPTPAFSSGAPQPAMMRFSEAAQAACRPHDAAPSSRPARSPVRSATTSGHYPHASSSSVSPGPASRSPGPCSARGVGPGPMLKGGSSRSPVRSIPSQSGSQRRTPSLQGMVGPSRR